MEQRKKRITLISIVIILVALSVAFTSMLNAAYIKNSNDVVNTFKPADSIIPEIVEDFDGTAKKNVYFEVGDTEYPVYVRATIVFTWQDETGIVYYSKPIEATPILSDGGEIIGYDGDYTIDLNLSDTDWEYNEKDGFYYFKNPVKSGDKTGILINECRQVNAAPVEGYTLSVEIIVQTVQAVGYTDEDNENGVIPAYQDAWNLYTASGSETETEPETEPNTEPETETTTEGN